MSDPIKNVAKLMEATMKICSEIILHTNGVFANFVKYNISNPQKSAALLEATTMLASLWTALNAIRFATADVAYCRKSLLLLQMSGKKDPEYVKKKQQVIESEFFKFQSAVNVIVEALQFFSKFQTDQHYMDVVNMLITVNKKIEKTSVPELRSSVSTSGTSAKSVKVGKAEHVYQDAIAIRDRLRTSALTGLTSESEILNYVRSYYSCKTVDEFIELSRFSYKDKMKRVAIASGLHMDRLIPVDLVYRIQAYIQHHTVQYQAPRSFTFKVELDELDGEITTTIDGEEYRGVVASLKAALDLLRNIDIQILRNFSGTPTASPSNGRKPVMDSIRACLDTLEKDSEYFIFGGGDTKIMDAVKSMDKFEKNNSKKLKNLESKFAKKAPVVEELIALWEKLIGPDTSTCIKHLFPLLQNTTPEKLL